MIDCFPFFNELDALEIRLNSLKSYVDRFILAECAQTHTGNSKPLFFEENKDRFKEFNIMHLIIPPIGGTPWEREEYGREYLLDSLRNVSPEEIILISDLDEIPNLKNYNGEEGGFRNSLYRYYFNCFTGKRDWIGTFAVKKKNIDRKYIEYKQRVKLKKTILIVGDGWHFSSIGTTEDIIFKLESCADQRFNFPRYKNRVAESKRNLIGYFDTDEKFIIEQPSGPEWLLKNKDKYPDLFVEKKK